MQEVDIGPPSGPDHHECTSTTEGDWVIFRCRRCPDYERWLNVCTGDTRAWNMRPEVRHSGHHAPAEYQDRSGYLH